MNTVLKILFSSTLVFQTMSSAGENFTGQDIKRMLSKKDSYEYKLVGRRLLRPIDEALLKRLAANPDKSGKHDYVLSCWLLRAAAESNQQYSWLLKSKELMNGGQPDDILLAYDYNVNGNKKALESLLERVRKSVKDGHSWDSARVYALAAIDEWNLCRQTLGSGWMSADGAGEDERYAFWITRRYFFPESKVFPDDYDTFCRDLEQLQSTAKQDDAGQPATDPEPKQEGKKKPKPKSKVGSR